MSLKQTEYPHNLGAASTGHHKIVCLRPYLNSEGVHTTWLPVLKNIDETVSHSPRNVLYDKLRDYAPMVASHLSWLADIGQGQNAMSVLDVLALDMPNGPGPFHDASRVLKKGVKNNAIYVAAEHFGEMLTREPQDGWYWNAYIATASVAPVDLRGHVHTQQAKHLWDTPWYVGYSITLTRLLSQPKLITDLVEGGYLSANVFNPNTIEGVKTEILAREVVGLSSYLSLGNIKMRIQNKNIDQIVDSQSTLESLDCLWAKMDSVMANATPGLACQMAQTIASFAS